MAGKTIENKAPITLDALKAKVQEKYTGQFFEHPEGYGTQELARLKRREREAIQRDTRRPDGTVDVALQNRMAAAFGLVNPKLTAEELLEYPDDFIEPIAERVWEISNTYRDTDADGKGGADSEAPFTKRSSSASGAATSSVGDSPKSTS